MDQEGIIKELNKCLLTDKEMELGPDGWEEFPDPFDDWEIMFESGSDSDSMSEEATKKPHVHGPGCSHHH